MHCVASWKALLRVLPPTSNIVTQQNFVVASWKKLLKKVDASSTCCFNLQQRNFVAWQCLRLVVICATLFNLQRNNVAWYINSRLHSNSPTSHFCIMTSSSHSTKIVCDSFFLFSFLFFFLYFGTLGPFQTSNFSCVGVLNANELEQRILRICITFDTS